MSVGGVFVSCFAIFVGLRRAEIISAIPRARGPYFWSALLAPRRHTRFAARVTGGFNLLGKVESQLSDHWFAYRTRLQSE